MHLLAHCHGFSLVEMITTLAVASVMLLAAILSTRDISRNLPLEKSALALQSFLDNCALASMLSEKKLLVTYSPEDNTIVAESTLETKALEVNKKGIRLLHVVPHNIYVTSAHFSTAPATALPHIKTLILRPNGSASPGRITLQSRFDEKTCSVIQALRGARRVVCAN